ncbi:hypothetical protein ACFXPS_01005 [Nocardia sp. NPDC059091]|uniref:hypothetical protein n=1 Tax=unclassified Nocardia TaxID=2637762 RepID=UPI0036BCDD16
MSNNNVLAEMIAGRLDQARTRAERSVRAASVARARAGQQPFPRFSRSEVKEVRAEARAQAKRMVAELTGKACGPAGTAYDRAVKA